MKNITQSYNDLLVDLYDQLFSISEEEYAFFRHFLIKVPGPALEVACGTGQFLIPLIQEGFQVVGLDSSQAMLAVCEQKLTLLSLKTQLICQRMEDMDIHQMFKTLYIPSCSFMHVIDINDAQRALHKFYSHLEPGGQLLVSLFLKKKETSLALLGDYELNGQKIRCSREFIHYPTEKLQKADYHFDVYEDDALISSSVHSLVWRLYEIDEFSVMLSQAGFKSVSLYGDYSLFSPDEDSEIVTFRAMKL